MPRTHHNSQVPGISLTSAEPSQLRCAPAADCSGALEVIRAAVTNLRLYRERLTLDDYIATLEDIESAAEQIFDGVTVEDAPLATTVRSAKRRAQ